MRKQSKTGLRVMGCLLLLTAIGLGCGRFTHKNGSSPTSPAQAAPLANFYTTGATSNRFEWRSGGEVFCVNVPAPGDYLLRYTTKNGTFYLALRVKQPARLFIGLVCGDELIDFSLQPGKVSETAIIYQETETTILFTKPAASTSAFSAQAKDCPPMVITGPSLGPDWPDFFTVDPAAPGIEWVEGGGPCPPVDPCPTPTPTPVPLAATYTIRINLAGDFGIGACNNATSNPAGPILVPAGGSQTLTFDPGHPNCCSVQNIQVIGASTSGITPELPGARGAIETLDLRNIQSDQQIIVTFFREPC